MNDLADHPVQAAAAHDGDVTTLDTPSATNPRPALLRQRSVVIGVAVAVLLAGLAAGGVWWHRQVTADPGLEFYGGPNVFRDEAGTDRTGIEDKHNLVGDEVTVAFVANGRLYAHYGLYNGGRHDVRIDAAPRSGSYYWGSEGMSLSADPDDGFVGVAHRYEPFRAFTLRRGETREVRLEFRLADCDPAALQPGGYSIRRGLTLRYRILGITRRHHVPIRDTAIALQAIGGCRNPIVDDGERAEVATPSPRHSPCGVRQVGQMA